MAHLEPLSKENSPELAEYFETFENILGFVPNSLLTMQRRPEIVKGFSALTKGVMDPDGVVDLGGWAVLGVLAGNPGEPTTSKGADFQRVPTSSSTVGQTRSAIGWSASISNP